MDQKNPFRRPLFWLTFTAVWFDLSHSWADIISHTVRAGLTMNGVAWTMVVIIATCHHWWQDRDP